MSQPTKQAALEYALDRLVRWARTVSAAGDIKFSGDHPLTVAEALLATPSPQPTPAAEPAMWQYRAYYDTCAGDGKPGWGAWEEVVPRNVYTETVADRVREIQAYIEQGKRYELRALYATPSPLPAAAGVEERARLAGECKRLVDDLAEESAGYAAGEPNRETVLERRRVVHALLDRLASSAAQVPEGWQFDIIGGVARIKTPDGSLTAWAPRDSVDPADQTLYRLAAAMVDRAAAPAAGGEQS